MNRLFFVGLFVGLTNAMQTPTATIGGSAAGDPHYVTFDGSALNFQGGCKYFLSGTDPRFDTYFGDRVWKVYVQNKHMFDKATNQIVAYTSMAHVEAHGHVISVREHFKVRIDDKEEIEDVQLLDGKVVGMTNQIYIQAESVDNEIVAVNVIVPKLNFQLRYDGRGSGGRHWAVVNLLAYREDLSDLMEFQGKLAGLLGNFNGDAEDDMIPKGGTRRGTDVEVGNSWQLDKELCGF